MSDSTFHFKEFSVNQDRCAMKVGTDSVLFGAWINPNQSQFALDIGTGTGILSLMLAQKSKTVIDAIDIDLEACEQARENIAESKWSKRINVYHTSLQDFMHRALMVYDLIISNPPYFVDAHKAIDSARNVARHMDESLSIDDLISGVLKLLSDEGRFCIILPYKEGMLFYEKAMLNKLYCSRLTRVRTKADKPEKRLMMEFCRHMQIIEEDEIVIQENENNFTQQYINLTMDFYLNLGKQR